MTTSTEQDTGMGGRGACPDDETVAAYIDHQLDAAAVVRFEAHVADCDACVTLLAALALPSEELETPAGGPEEGPAGRVLPFPPPAPEVAPSPTAPVRLRRWLTPVAAVLVVGLGAGLAWRLLSQPGPGIPELQQAALVASTEVAAERSRYTFGRLSGFPYGAPPVVRRSGARGAGDEAPLSLLDVARQVEAARAGRADAASLHAYGVALLVGGDVEAAVERLTRAAAAAPDDPRVLNDAATAYLQQAQLTSSATALAEARRLAEQAVQKEPTLAEGWFNLAQVAVLSDDAELRTRAMERLRALGGAAEWLRELEAP